MKKHFNENKKGLNERNKNVLSFFNSPGTCIYMYGSHALTHAKLTKRNTKWKVFPDSCFVSFDSQAIRLFIRSLFFHGSSKRKFFIVNLNPIEWNKNKTKTRMSCFMYLCRLGCLVNHENHDLHLIDWIENPTNLFQWFFVPLWLAGTFLWKYPVYNAKSIIMFVSLKDAKCATENRSARKYGYTMNYVTSEL